MMPIINWINENIILPIGDIALDQSISKKLNFLMESQWWSESDLKEYQNEKLRKLIRHSYENVPYYNELFNKLKLKPDDINKIDDLYKLPILTKKVVRENVKNGKIIAKNLRRNDMVFMSSSGSTGEPLGYFTTKDAYSINIATNLRGWYWMGYKLGDRFIKISNSPRNRLKKIQDFMIKNYCIYFNQFDERFIRFVIRKINEYNPKILRSYPAPLSLIMSLAEKNGMSFPRLNAVNTTGNILYPEFRKKIEENFKCKVFDSYSCEGGANIFECQTHECYHSSMEYAITEIFDSKGKNKSYKRVATTDLWNYATPFLRYNTKDLIEFKSESCSCGRSLLPVKKIIGRDTDVLVAPDGSYINPHLISTFFKKIEGIEQFQVKQEKIDEFFVLLKIKENKIKKAKKIIENFWYENFGKDIRVNIRKVDNIPLTTSGKRRYIIRTDSIKL
jgi:phenylacetate-CoA ligase